MRCNWVRCPTPSALLFLDHKFTMICWVHMRGYTQEVLRPSNVVHVLHFRASLCNVVQACASWCQEGTKQSKTT